MKIQPKISANIQEFIQSQDLHQIKNLHEGVIHIGFPQEMTNNVKRFKDAFSKFDIDLDIYFAHKSSKNIAFVKQAKQQNIYIDVASKNELLSALDAGFKGGQIEATGPKNKQFLELALRNQCLISLDSISELKRLIEIKNISQEEVQLEVLIRLNSLQINGRNVQVKNSRFGINFQEIDKAFDLLKENNIVLKGFHFHADGYDSTMRGGFIESMLELVKLTYQEGFTPSVINIGGAFRDQTLENYEGWSKYIESMEERLINQKPLPTWANQTFGLSLNKNHKISGKEKAMSRFYKYKFEDDIQSLLSHKDTENRALSDIINENMITLSIEPGYALLQQCGISLVEVIETKKASDGRALVVLDANIYNLGLAKMFRYHTDPILISKSKSTQCFPAFVAGNLCREDDFLIDRLIHFPQQPQPGDILVFTNTAAYFAGFEDASPIMHPTSKFLAASKSAQEKWMISSPQDYDPLISSYDL